MSFKEKYNESKSILLMGFLFVFGIILLSFTSKNASYTFSGKAKDGNAIVASGGEFKKSDIITIDIDFLTPAYAESKGANRFGLTHSYYYIAWLDDGSLITISAKDANKIQELNKFSSEVYDYVMGKTSVAPKPITVTGELHKLDSEVAEYFKKEVEIAKYSLNPNTMSMEVDNSKFTKIYDLEIDTSYSRTLMAIFTIFAIVLTFASGAGLLYIIIGSKSKSSTSSASAYSDTYETRTSAMSDNDPIFNRSFYNTYANKGSVNNTSEKTKDSEPDYEPGSLNYDSDNDSEETDEPISTGSKFKLKDND